MCCSIPPCVCALLLDVGSGFRPGPLFNSLVGTTSAANLLAISILSKQFLSKAEMVVLSQLHELEKLIAQADDYEKRGERLVGG